MIREEDTIEILINSIQKDLPFILFLGQRFLDVDTNNDLLIKKFQERLEKQNRLSTEILSWSSLAKIQKITSDDNIWLQERFENHRLPDTIKGNLYFPWFGVFTTSIDPRIKKSLETYGRQPETIVVSNTNPKKVRSKYSPPLYYLYSNSNELQNNYHIPYTSSELLSRTYQETLPMLRKLSSTITGMGILVVEGYDSNKDWLELEQFLANIPLNSTYKIIWCGLKQKPKNDLFIELEKKGIIIAEPQSLNALITQLRLKIPEYIENNIRKDEKGFITISNNETIEIPPAMKLTIESSIFIIDDEWSEKTLEDQNSYDDFRQFHSGMNSLKKDFQCVQNNYAIVREFENELNEKVELLLRSKKEHNKVIVLHGSSATGKSIALIRLAINMRNKNKIPVLFTNKYNPDIFSVNEFCLEAERQGAHETIVICDTNTSESYLFELERELRSKGRRSIIIGSSYKITTASVLNYAIEAPAQITQEEFKKLKELISGFSSTGINHIYNHNNPNFLGLLYRILTVSRPSLIKSISNEATTIEKEIRDRIRMAPDSVSNFFSSIITEKLVDANLVQNDHKNIFCLDTEESSPEYQILDYIMTIGKIGCSIPINLLFRTLTKVSNVEIENLSFIFNDLDLFKIDYSDNEETELLIGPRTTLEATIICQRRIGEENTELMYITDLIQNVQPKSLDKDSELHFLYSLLERLIKDKSRSPRWYLEIAKSLTILREDEKFIDYNLILQESSFRRETLSVYDSNRTNDSVSDDTRFLILEEAREAIQYALDYINEGDISISPNLKKNLYGERASIYGFLSVAEARGREQSQYSQGIRAVYRATKDAISEAKNGTNSYYPIDINLWTCIDVLNNKESLSKDVLVEVFSDLRFIADTVDRESLSPNQLSYFEKQMTRASRVLDDKSLREDALKNLEKLDPVYVYFFKAREMCPEIFIDPYKTYSVEISIKALEAYNYLKQYQHQLDEKCLTYMLEFLWVSKIKQRSLRGSKHQHIPDEKDFLASALSIVQQLNLLMGERSYNKYRFLEAVLLWMTGSETLAYSIWKELEMATEYIDVSRVYKQLYICDENFKPKEFSARIDDRISNHRWKASLYNRNGLHITVRKNDFKKIELELGRELNKFGISFNYIGPIPDTRLLDGSAD